MNKYLDINRLEFSVTYSCTGNCNHCSVGDKLKSSSSVIEKNVAVKAVCGLKNMYEIKSVMTFGGEPLLYYETTAAIQKAACDSGIPDRQIITNGYFSKNHEKISEAVQELKESGVTEILLSVDSFHAEKIPLNVVLDFAKSVKEADFCKLILQPAWLVNESSNNRYNAETRKCLSFFDELNLEINEGNNIFPAGNALKNFSDYYPKKPFNPDFKCGDAVYSDKLDDVKTLSVDPDGNVFACCIPIGNLYDNSIIEIVKNYDPHKIETANALVNGGIRELIKLAENRGLMIDLSDFYSPCNVCHYICERLNEKRT